MAKSIMIQGTMSNAGKSLIAAGLCRIFHQDGYRVAPFKSQNMALNSFITREGLEMGRAQVVQAEAAGIEPSVLMNPILLKPTTDVGSQVIVNGRVLGNMKAREYFRFKKQLVPEIMTAYEQLSRENDIIVIEGAGSPAEINLKQEDIVNMGLAKLTDSPVLLVGDIDPGGVFAQLIGTLVLLTEEERARVAGLVINKLRGDPTILTPGLRELEARSGKPVLGVVPYLSVDIDAEDSLSPALQKHALQAGARVDIAVLRLPHISNFTDFQALTLMEGVSVRYVSQLSELGTPDLLILPGTKSTIADLRWLRASGLAAGILKLSDKGCLVLGICGGFQMLGTVLYDPDGVEIDSSSGLMSSGGEPGLGLLAMETRFTGEKRRTRVDGLVLTLPSASAWATLSGAAFSGYEIHMGRSTECGTADAEGEAADVGTAFARLRDTVQGCESLDGAVCGNVLGTYVHGLFDSEDFRERLRALLFRRKGLEATQGNDCSYRDYKEQQYELLAAQLRKSLDMARIYEIMGLEGPRN